MLNNLVECLRTTSVNFGGIPKVQVASTPTWFLSMGTHSLFESGEKEGIERLIFCKPKLFLINNLYSIHIYSKERINSTTAKNDVITLNQDARLIEFFRIIDDELNREMESFIQCILKTVVLSSDDLKFSKKFENDKNEKSKMLKAMFSAFNGGISALITQQNEWRIAYADLRDELDTRIKESIMNAYLEFYHANSKINFSKKHMELYIKYKPEDINKIITGYFKNNKNK